MVGASYVIDPQTTVKLRSDLIKKDMDFAIVVDLSSELSFTACGGLTFPKEEPYFGLKVDLNL